MTGLGLGYHMEKWASGQGPAHAVQELDFDNLFWNFSSIKGQIKTADFGKTFFTFCVAEAALWLFTIFDSHLYFLSLFAAGRFLKLRL